jgi:hypothetical protein
MDWSIRGSHFASVYGLVYSPALRVSRHARLISATEVAEGPQPHRVLCTLPFAIIHYTILSVSHSQQLQADPIEYREM